MWQRSDLYLNIAHSLNAVCLRAQSTALGEKVGKLQPVGAGPNSDCLHPFIKAHLWESTTQGLAQQKKTQGIPHLDPAHGLDQMIMSKDSQDLMEHDIPRVTPVIDESYLFVNRFHDSTMPEDVDDKLMLLESCQEGDNGLDLEDEIFGSSQENDMLMDAPEEDDIGEELLLLY